MAKKQRKPTIIAGDIKKRHPRYLTENAPAASALLYNIVGQGEAFNNLRKDFQEIIKNLKLK